MENKLANAYIKHLKNPTNSQDYHLIVVKEAEKKLKDLKEKAKKFSES